VVSKWGSLDYRTVHPSFLPQQAALHTPQFFTFPSITFRLPPSLPSPPLTRCCWDSQPLSMPSVIQSRNDASYVLSQVRYYPLFLHVRRADLLKTVTDHCFPIRYRLYRPTDSVHPRVQQRKPNKSTSAILIQVRRRQRERDRAYVQYEPPRVCKLG
jgi:hypothetical protein